MSKRTPKFFIQNGVRRALASREAGRKTIPAILYRAGRKPVPFPRMRLANLYSPKAAVEHDDRYARITMPIEQPIEIEPLNRALQPQAVPLADVRLV